jgi:hypothetical protein
MIQRRFRQLRLAREAMLAHRAEMERLQVVYLEWGMMFVVVFV